MELSNYQKAKSYLQLHPMREPHVDLKEHGTMALKHNNELQLMRELQ
jgi:hypothetical protein